MSLQCGVPQSNRCGDFDPYIIMFMHEYAGLNYEDVTKELQTRSGLLGISGISNDLRDIMEAAEDGNTRARLAVDIYIKEVTGYIGRYAAEMGGLDAVAFTGGIGENSEYVRSKVMEKLQFISGLKQYVIPANEELGVARQTYMALNREKS